MSTPHENSNLFLSPPLFNGSLSVLFYIQPPSSKLILSKSSFSHLSNWKKDNQIKAFQAFKLSCLAILKLDSNSLFHPIKEGGTTKDWQRICLAANQMKLISKANTKIFFETWFEPYQIRDHNHREGLFTGYYLPIIKGSIKANK